MNMNLLLRPFKGSVKAFRKIKKILGYLTLLWKDEDWDYNYLLELMHHKLKRMQLELRDNRVCPVVGQEKIQRRLDVIVESLKRLCEDDYMTEEHGELLESWWKSRTETLIEIKGEEMISMNFDEFPHFKQVKLRHLGKLADERRKADMARVFRGLSKYVTRFWD